MIENRFKKGLGRGLSSLIGDSSKNIKTNKVLIKDLTRNILTKKIWKNLLIRLEHKVLFNLLWLDLTKLQMENMK